MIEELLHDIGLSKKETQIYLCLLRLGSASAADIGKELDMPRQTAYSILNDLIQEEYIEKSKAEGTTVFSANPAKLFYLLEKKKKKLDQSKEKLEKKLPEILSLRKKKKEFPKIQYYEGTKGLQRLFNSIIDQYKNNEDTMFRGFAINKYSDWDLNFIKEFAKQRHALGVKSHLMIAPGPDDFVDDAQNLGRIVKRIDIEPQKAGAYMIGNRLYLFSYIDEVGVVIENKAIANLLKSIFDERWEKK